MIDVDILTESRPAPVEPGLPRCSSCIEGWLSRPDDGEPDVASVIFGDELICGFHAQILWDNAPAIRIFGYRPESEWGARL